MLWPVLGDEGLRPPSPPLPPLPQPSAPRPASKASKSNKLVPLLLCAPCKPTQRKRQSTTRWYVQQPTWRLWGEEKGDGVIYTVYLKKVRYHRPTRSLSTSESDDEISHLEWETVRVRFLKAGTVQRLVESLANDDGELESTYINVFLATYRAFTTPPEVLELLLVRYDSLDEAANAQHRKTLVQALHVWLDAYPGDWRSSPGHPLLTRLLDFAHRRLPGSELELKARHRLHSFSQPDDQLDNSCTIYDNGRLGLHCSGDTFADSWSSYSFPEVSHRHLAEQLTRMDAEVFRKLVAHQCLGAVWSRRGDRSRSHDAATVLATVNQFNAVSLRVISTILLADEGTKAQERARVIETWIDVAQELRILKNFSSLKAIVSGLQSNPVYRLEKCWQCMTREKHELFRELERIFSEENNAWTQRELLIKEGTAKFADTAGRSDRHLQKIFQKQNIHAGNISYGTIPYLGTFLTDLTMIDTAIPDTIAEGLINFDKRRKEFEVLARIRLLQGAANAYNFNVDPLFERWFHSIVVLDDRESYNLSCQIEIPPAGSTINNRSTAAKKKLQQNHNNSQQQHQHQHHHHNHSNNHNQSGHRKNDSIASTSSSSSSQFYCDLDSLPSSPHNSLDRRISPSQMSSSSSSSSLPSLDISLSSGGGNGAGNSQSRLNVSQGGNSNGTAAGLPSPSHSHKSSPDFYIIKVTIESDNVETEGVILYKSIMLSNNERTPQVIRNAMLKLGIEGNPDQFTLAQVLPDREMVLPNSANVYYAVNTAHNLNFILRPKKT
ncbi:PREDICTED: ral guanine nucleotide dissociation stimulator [Ceratosolen solmsi marchali]|uniref:Ral guanine nucleotide dissociation stimulator n=1 Tax=Ceratosolen solmsi marchali TaxID=326594 RepID=A0AAJ6YW97_9HYME|nr:PREDICTED: ral guanine nucleotide dissociation stimulator [Ceratosolen solmsi marchali]